MEKNVSSHPERPETPEWEIEGRAIARKYRLNPVRVLPHGYAAAMEGKSDDEVIEHMENQAKILVGQVGIS